MEIQIFGTKKSAETRKALRFFAERRIKPHFVDLNERAASPEEDAMRSEMAGEVERAMEALTDREREVLRLRYGLGTDQEWTLDQIGRRLSITRERVRQIERKAVQKIRAARGHAA